MNHDNLHHTEHHQLASEVLTLGDELFEMALQHHSLGKMAENQPDGEGNQEVQTEPFPLEEFQAARAQFFTALRLLLNVEQ